MGYLGLEKITKIRHLISIPESFNMIISHQLFDYKITFGNSQRENTISKGDFVLKKQFETFVLKISGIQKIIRLKFGKTNSSF